MPSPRRAQGGVSRVGGVIGPVLRWGRSVRPRRRHLRADALAGLPGAISNVPDGMASGVLAGVSPVSGLYAAFAGPIAGGLGTSTRLMVITTTSAAALAAGSGISGIAAEDRAGALTLLTVIAGALMLVAGILRLGRYTRFVSHSVMLGFLSGVGVNIIFGQLSDLTGAPTQGSTNLQKAIRVLAHPGRWDLSSLLVGLAALAILVLLSRTRLAVVSALLALAVPTIVVLVFGLDSVTQVEDGGAIPKGFPLPALPDFGQLSGSVLAAAAAVAAIVLVQGAGVAESAPNDDGTSDANQDFVAQGAGNLAAGLFKGMPVGGSVGSTALNVTAGGRTRWAAMWCGIWMAVILVAFSGVVGEVAMPTLAAILIFAGFRSLRPHEVMTIMRTGPNSQIAVIATFGATLLLPVAAAVGLGVVISLLLQLNQEAIDLAVVQLQADEHGRFVEHPPPAHLEPGSVTVLDVYGSLFYAGSRTLQARLPDATGATGASVVLRLRGRTTLGATFFRVASGYAARLEAEGGRLYLTGLDTNLAARLRGTSRDPLTGPALLYEATPVVGESTLAALRDATAWQVRHGGRPTEAP
jgi:SulP family sulfate permease